MLKGIHPCISPNLLKILAEMGHGDEIVLADAHFPVKPLDCHIIRADGIDIATLLKGIIPLFELDSYVDSPLIMMQAVAGDALDPGVEQRYRQAIMHHRGQCPAITRIERGEFYVRAKNAYAVVFSGELAKYGNIILKKGVTPVIKD